MRYYKLFPNATLYIIDSEAFMQKKCTPFEFCEYTFGSVIMTKEKMQSGFSNIKSSQSLQATRAE